jgi:hypothetical protein
MDDDNLRDKILGLEAQIDGFGWYEKRRVSW